MNKSGVIFLLFCTVAMTTWHCQTSNAVEKGTTEHIKNVTSQIDDAKLAAQETEHGDWLTYGRNYKEDRYSLLDQITKENVTDLGLAWTLEVGTKRGIDLEV